MDCAKSKFGTNSWNDYKALMNQLSGLVQFALSTLSLVRSYVVVNHSEI